MCGGKFRREERDPAPPGVMLQDNGTSRQAAHLVKGSVQKGLKHYTKSGTRVLNLNEPQPGSVIASADRE